MIQKYDTDKDIKLEQIPELICSDIKVKQEMVATPENIDNAHNSLKFDYIKSEDIVKTEIKPDVDPSHVFEVYEEVKYSPVCSSSKDSFINKTVNNMVTHGDVKMYNCSHCEYTTARKGNFVVHRRTHSKYLLCRYMLFRIFLHGSRCYYLIFSLSRTNY